MVRPTRSIRRSLLPAVLLLAGVCLATPAIAHALDNEPVFQFTGRGNGHGVGMSQWGAKGMADHGWTYQQILARYFSGSWIAPWTGTTTVHVNLDPNVTPSLSKYSRSSWRLAPGHATGSFLRVNGVPAPNANTYRFAGSGTSVLVYDTKNTSATTDDTLWKTLTGIVDVDETTSTPTLTKVVDTSGYGNVAGKSYRGQLELSASGGMLKLLNEVGVEGYIYGVVPLESSASWPAESLKAQAVAARAYALKSSGELYCTTYSQVYGGFGSEASASNAAVDATNGQVVWANDSAGQPTVVKTYFFASSGGHTENIENVWGAWNPVNGETYYVGVDDPYEVGGRHIWKEEVNSSGVRVYDGTPARIASSLRTSLVALGLPVPATLTGVEIPAASRGVSGKARYVILHGAANDDVTLSGSQVSRFGDVFGWGSDIFYATSFRWDSTSVAISSDGYAHAKFHVFPAVTGTVKGLVTVDANNKVVALAGQDLQVVNGVGEARIAATGRYGVDGLVYNDSANELRGTDRLYRNRTYPLTVTPYVPETTGTVAPTAITISSSAYSARYYSPFILTGVLTPGKLSDPCLVEVRKPGTSRWSYSSLRLAYTTTSAGGAVWWYRYTPKLRGTYAFRVRFAGDATRAPSLSRVIYVTVR